MVLLFRRDRRVADRRVDDTVFRLFRCRALKFLQASSATGQFGFRLVKIFFDFGDLIDVCFMRVSYRCHTRCVLPGAQFLFGLPELVSKIVDLSRKLLFVDARQRVDGHMLLLISVKQAAEDRLQYFRVRVAEHNLDGVVLSSRFDQQILHNHRRGPDSIRASSSFGQYLFGPDVVGHLNRQVEAGQDFLLCINDAFSSGIRRFDLRIPCARIQESCFAFPHIFHE